MRDWIGGVLRLLHCFQSGVELMVVRASDTLNLPQSEQGTNAVIGEVDIEDMDRDEVIDALCRVTASERFRNSERLCEFLNYVVGETLEGRGALIKARTIAADVFGRHNFDEASGDAIVRTSAHRLRMLLEGHFNDEGAADPYRIILRKGSYVPKFQRVQHTAIQTEPDALRIMRSVPFESRNGKARKQSRSSSKRLHGANWVRTAERAAVVALVLAIIAAAALSYYWVNGAERAKGARISVTMSATSSGLPEGISEELQRRLVSNLVSFGNATIVDRTHAKKYASDSCLFGLDASIIQSDGLAVDWKLVDTASGTVVATGHEKLVSGGYATLDRAADIIAGEVLGVDGALAHWSSATEADTPASSCYPMLFSPRRPSIEVGP